MQHSLPLTLDVAVPLNSNAGSSTDSSGRKQASQ